jgi:outer membrane protein assembly factor BamA
VTFVAEWKADNRTPGSGFYADTGSMITGAGWISGGPGYRHRVLRDRAVVDVSAAVSWRFYKTAQGRFELPALRGGRVTVGAQALWRDMTQVRDADTDYRLRTANVVGYTTVRSGHRPLSLTAAAGWLDRPRVSSSTGPFDRDLPDTAAGGAPQPSFVHGDLSLVHDTRNDPGHPTGGGLYRGTWVGFRDRDGGAHSFARYETEGLQVVPIAGGRLVIAARGLGVFSTTSGGRTIPFYLLPALGGHNTLRGYADYRFHDRHALVANLESRFPLLAHVDGAVFFDAGNVAPRVEDLDLARTSYGAGVRLHTGASTLARLDVARGHEGWRVLFRMSDPLRLARLSRRTAAAPFVP